MEDKAEEKEGKGCGTILLIIFSCFAVAGLFNYFGNKYLGSYGSAIFYGFILVSIAVMLIVGIFKK